MKGMFPFVTLLLAPTESLFCQESDNNNVVLNNVKSDVFDSYHFSLSQGYKRYDAIFTTVKVAKTEGLCNPVAKKTKRPQTLVICDLDHELNRDNIICLCGHFSRVIVLVANTETHPATEMSAVADTMRSLQGRDPFCNVYAIEAGTNVPSWIFETLNKMFKINDILIDVRDGELNRNILTKCNVEEVIWLDLPPEKCMRKEHTPEPGEVNTVEDAECYFRLDLVDIKNYGNNVRTLIFYVDRTFGPEEKHLF